MRTQLPPAALVTRRRPRVLVVAVGVLAGVAVLLAVLLVRGGATTPPALRSAAPPATPTSPTASSIRAEGFTADGAAAAYLAIQRRRDRAYAMADGALLRQVYTPTCPCLAQDLGDLALERRGGYRFAGPATRVRNVHVRSLDRAARTAFVAAEVNYGAATYTDPAGNVRFVEQDKGWQTAQTLLAWDGQRWRVAAVVALR